MQKPLHSFASESVVHSCRWRPAQRSWLRQRVSDYRQQEQGHICRVTNGEDEMQDPRSPYRDAHRLLNMGPQYQIPQPELGPLEQRIEKTYIEAMYTDEVSIEDTNYWFTEPEGGWNNEDQMGYQMPEEETEPCGGDHFGPGRTELHELEEGTIMQGEVVCLMYYHGVQVDLGAQYDGLIPVRGEEWQNDHFRSKFGVSSGVSDDFEIGQTVTVEIHRINHRPKCRFPIQLTVIDPDVQHKIMDPDDWNFSFDLRNVESWEEACQITGRPMPTDIPAENYLSAELVTELERTFRSKELSSMMYGSEDVDFDDIRIQPPIAQQIEEEAQLRASGVTREPSWEGEEDDNAVIEEIDEVYEEIVPP